MPNQPKTPARSFRIRDEVYLPAQRKARAEGIHLTEVVIDALVDYVGDEDWSEPTGDTGEQPIADDTSGDD